MQVWPMYSTATGDVDFVNTPQHRAWMGGGLILLWIRRLRSFGVVNPLVRAPEFYVARENDIAVEAWCQESTYKIVLIVSISAKQADMWTANFQITSMSLDHWTCSLPTSLSFIREIASYAWDILEAFEMTHSPNNIASSILSLVRRKLLLRNFLA